MLKLQNILTFTFASAACGLLSLVFAAAAHAESSVSSEWFSSSIELREDDTLVLESIPGTMKLSESSGDLIFVKYRGLDEGQVKLVRDGKRVSVKGAAGADSGITVVDGGSTVSVNSSGSNNRVIVNGKEIVSPSESTQEAEVEIQIPRGSDVVFKSRVSGEASVALGAVEIRLSGISSLTLPAAESAEIELGGTSRLTLGEASGSVHAKISGVGKLTLEESSDAELSASLSGSSRLSASGTFKTLTLETSSSAAVETNGLVEGDASFKASGASRIIHRGEIRGELKRSRSGAARISVDF